MTENPSVYTSLTNPSVYDALIAEATPAPEKSSADYLAEIERLNGEISRLNDSKKYINDLLVAERRDYSDRRSDLKSYLFENTDNLDAEEIANIFGIVLEVTVDVTAVIRHTFSATMSLEDYQNFSAETLNFEVTADYRDAISVDDSDYIVDEWSVGDPQ